MATKRQLQLFHFRKESTNKTHYICEPTIYYIFQQNTMNNAKISFFLPDCSVADGDLSEFSKLDQNTIKLS